jgi:hypothetical protein
MRGSTDVIVLSNGFDPSSPHGKCGVLATRRREHVQESNLLKVYLKQTGSACFPS